MARCAGVCARFIRGVSLRADGIGVAFVETFGLCRGDTGAKSAVLGETLSVKLSEIAVVGGGFAGEVIRD